MLIYVILLSSDCLKVQGHLVPRLCTQNETVLLSTQSTCLKLWVRNPIFCDFWGWGSKPPGSAPKFSMLVTFFRQYFCPKNALIPAAYMQVHFRLNCIMEANNMDPDQTTPKRPPSGILWSSSEDWGVWPSPGFISNHYLPFYDLQSSQM